MVNPRVWCGLCCLILCCILSSTLYAQNGISAVESSSSTAGSTIDNLWADSTDHRWKVNSNGGLGASGANQDLAFWPCNSLTVTGGIVYGGAVPLNGTISQENCLYLPVPQVSGVPLLVGSGAPQWGAEYLDLQANALVSELGNNTAGTTQFYLVTLVATTGASPVTQVETASASQASGIEGICINGCGTTGTAQIARGGIASCSFDGSTTANDYVQTSATPGKCHDAGSSVPSNGSQVIGRVLSNQTGIGNNTIELYTSGIVPPSNPLPVNQGGTGTQSTLTGIVRGGSPLSASELSGDVTTSGSNVAKVIQIEGASIPTSVSAVGTNASGQLVASAHGSCAQQGPSSAYSNSSTTPSTVLTSCTIPTSTTVYVRCTGQYTFSTAADLYLTLVPSQTASSLTYQGLINTGATSMNAPIVVTNPGSLSSACSSTTCVKSTTMGSTTNSFAWALDGTVVTNVGTAGNIVVGAATSTSGNTVAMPQNQVSCMFVW